MEFFAKIGNGFKLFFTKKIHVTCLAGSKDATDNKDTKSTIKTLRWQSYNSDHNLTLYAPISQNGQTHSNNSSAKCLSVFDHFVGLALKGLTK